MKMKIAICVKAARRNILMNPMGNLEYKFYILRQVVERAKEAKAIGWTINGIAPEYRATSPGDIYEFLIKEADRMINEIEEIISCMNTEQKSQESLTEIQLTQQLIWDLGYF
jgi:hypothetical protein